MRPSCPILKRVCTAIQLAPWTLPQGRLFVEPAQINVDTTHWPVFGEQIPVKNSRCYSIFSEVQWSKFEMELLVPHGVFGVHQHCRPCLGKQLFALEKTKEKSNCSPM
jgi:hypothetical protein